ncbi:MAG TPA: stage II sporulation protein M [Nitrosopumilaceae archaeon]|nr:stage II sporulation protein M [Nitrosopumilaceae archaeon]
MTRKKRLLFLLIFAAIFSVSYSIGAEMPVSTEDAEIFLKEFQLAIEGIDAIGIFVHNISIALPMFIPGFGLIWGAFAAWSTGFAFSALETTNPILSQLPPLSVLFLSPFGLMELCAYSIGMSRSFLLISTIIKKNPIKNELRPTIIEIGIVIGLLVVGGFVEFEMIQQFGSDIDLPKS